MIVLNEIGACVFSFAFLACVDMISDGSRSSSKGERTAVVEVSTTLHPDAPFRSAASNRQSNPSCTTAPALLRLLKAYKPSAAQSVTVGVVGFPNVGKRSLINSLMRSKVHPVSRWHVVFVCETFFCLQGVRNCSTTWTYQGLANGPAGARPRDHRLSRRGIR